MPDDIFEKYNKQEEVKEMPPQEKPEVEPETVARPPEAREPKDEGRETKIEALQSEWEKRQSLYGTEKRGEISDEQRKIADRLVEELVALAREKGVKAAIDKARNKDPYILDRLRDKLASMQR